MRYEDFTIQIGTGSSGEYVARVIQSPAGEGVSHFKLPFAGEEIGALLFNMARTMGSSRQATVEAVRELSPMTELHSELTPRQVGDALFRALFSGDVLSLYDRSLGRIETEPDVGLRIKIKLDPQEHGLSLLHSIPWEVLHRRSTQEFLGLSRLSPVVRYLEVPRSVNAMALPRPLRILVVLANPKSMVGLDLERERNLLQSVWTGQNQVEVHALKHARLDLLRSALLERPFHVLHYMGHGGYLDQEQKGMLYFQKPDGSAEPVTGSNLAVHLSDFRSLRLVFLNACNTARAAGKAGVNPFSGVATALVMGGLPAVLAMQFPITDRAAIAFSRAFYGRLAMGEHLDTAVVEGRLAIRAREEATSEWGTPVLFTRVPDGKLFDRGEHPSDTQTRAGGTRTREIASSGSFSGKRAARQAPIVWAILCMVLITATMAVYRERWVPAVRAWLETESSEPAAREKSSGDWGASRPETADAKNRESLSTGLEKDVGTSVPPEISAGTPRKFTLIDGVTLEMVWIPPGSFTMGSPAGEQGRSSNERWHRVTISRGFWMSRTEVTQAHWTAVMGHNPSEFVDEGHPVERVTWWAVADFLYKVNLGFKGKDRFRLPTEAEWEYACRAGSEDAFAGDPDTMTWHRGNSVRSTHAVAAKTANAWGLHDMHGNVWEWCEDWKSTYPRSPQRDPRGPSSGTYKVIRGGSWDKEPIYCRSANRVFVGPDSYSKEIGFRLVRIPD